MDPLSSSSTDDKQRGEENTASRAASSENYHRGRTAPKKSDSQLVYQFELKPFDLKTKLSSHSIGYKERTSLPYKIKLKSHQDVDRFEQLL